MRGGTWLVDPKTGEKKAALAMDPKTGRRAAPTEAPKAKPRDDK